MEILELGLLRSYKNFWGTKEFDSYSKCYFGSITGINGLITYEADCLDDLQIAFEMAVEDYLEELQKEKNLNDLRN